MTNAVAERVGVLAKQAGRWEGVKVKTEPESPV
jgi:hypothetical protein